MDLIARLPITFEGLGGEQVHAPLVRCAINGRPALLILDTGADTHLITEDLVDLLGLEKVPGEEGIDHTGATMPSWNIGEVELLLDGFSSKLRGVVAIAAPPPFTRNGIVGSLSPQLIQASGWVVMDMVGDELLLVEGEHDEIEELVRERAPQLNPLSLVRDANFGTVVVDAAIEPYAEVPTLIDTGGRGTEFSSRAVPGIALRSSERLGGGVGGGDVVGSRVGTQTLLVDGHRIPVSSLALRPQMEGPQGLVGMDVLRGTVLACAVDRSQPVLWAIRR
jgi:hypothetical protein